jgi:hypothetical protein
MKRVAQFALAAIVAVGLAAFPTTVGAKGQKKAGGGSHSMTGCLQKGDDANTFKLTDVEGTGPKTVEIVAMASGVDLAPHVGHKVTITGTAVRAKAAAKAEGTTGTAVGAKAAAKGEGTKDVKKEPGEHHMRASAVKMVSTTCP